MSIHKTCVFLMLTFLGACSSDNEVTLYIVNNSRVVPKVDVEVTIDTDFERLVVCLSFPYSALHQKGQGPRKKLPALNISGIADK